MKRKFKPGDWVKLKGKTKSPKMEVLKYISKENTLLKLGSTSSYLECVWYKNGERKIEVFHQNKLIKAIESRGLFKT